jgi:hypothetical protein
MKTCNSNKKTLQIAAVAGAMLASTLSWGGAVNNLSIEPAISIMASPLVRYSPSQTPFAQGDAGEPSKVFGKTYGEWVAEWMKWVERSNAVAIFDTTGESCSENQPNSGVWFLAGSFGGEVERTCAIPHGRYLFYPLVETGWIDCPGTADVTTPNATVRDIMAYMLNNAGELTSTVDNITVSGLQMLIVRAQSPNFTGILTEDSFLDSSCPPGLPAGKTGRQIVDGYWVMLPPLSGGQHTLTLHGSGIAWDNNGIGTRIFENGVTYHLTVDPDKN